MRRKCSSGASALISPINAAFILSAWDDMDAVQKDRWYSVTLVVFIFLKVSVSQKDVETVRLEEGMVLSCLCPWHGNLSMVSWTKLHDDNPVAVFHPEYGVSLSQRYRERIEFLRSSPLDGSISIKNVTHQDIGQYQCSVQTFPQGPWTRDFQVEDLDEPPDYDITETPSSEETAADSNLVVERTHNLTIRCRRPPNDTVYQVILERKEQMLAWNIIGVCKKVEGGLVSEDYSDRGQIECEDSLDVGLHLPGVEEDDSGLYRCTFNTDVGVQTHTVRLAVSTTGGFSLSLYMMYIYIGAGAAGLLLLVAFFILLMRRRKNNRRVEYRVKLHPSQRQPNIYENISVKPKEARRHPRELRDSPIYANMQSVRSVQSRRKP